MRTSTATTPIIAIFPDVPISDGSHSFFDSAVSKLNANYQDEKDIQKVTTLIFDTEYGNVKYIASAPRNTPDDDTEEKTYEELKNKYRIWNGGDKQKALTLGIVNGKRHTVTEENANEIERLIAAYRVAYMMKEQSGLQRPVQQKSLDDIYESYVSMNVHKDVAKFLSKTEHGGWVCTYYLFYEGYNPVWTPRVHNEAETDSDEIIIDVVLAIYTYDKSNDEKLPFKKKEILYVIDKRNETWWYAMNQKGQKGYIPSDYVVPGKNDTNIAVIGTKAVWPLCLVKALIIHTKTQVDSDEFKVYMSQKAIKTYSLVDVSNQATIIASHGTLSDDDLREHLRQYRPDCRLSSISLNAYNSDKHGDSELTVQL